MKAFATLSLLLPSLAFGQSLTTTSPQNRTVLLEDFTGIHCGYCPDGHAIAAGLANAHPRLVSVVGVHAGGYAVPSGNDPDFRTPEGTALDSHFAPDGYPSGVLDRHSFDGAFTQDRGAWEGDVNDLLAMPSPVNLGVESTYDASSHTITVHVQLYYTADSPGDDDRIGVMITENHIIGPQTDYGPAGNHTDYDHMHVLRDYFTDVWGEAAAPNTAGTWVDRTYTLTAPDTWNIDNCDVVAFVGEYQTDVYQAYTIPVVGGTTLVVGDLQGSDPLFQHGTSGAGNNFGFTLNNLLGADESYAVELTTQSGPSSWGTSITVNGMDYPGSATVQVANAGNAQITAHVSPDAAPGIGDYLLTVTSTSNPQAPLLQQDLHVISGVHDLIVTNPQAEAWEPMYIASMQQANEAFSAHTTRDRFIKFGQANALSEVLNLYLNVSWTFPSLLDDEVAVLAQFMDAGGNLMIAGQDIGWDQSGADGSFGTAATQAFYAGHMLATFVADGTASNSPVDFVDGDAVFGTVPNSSLSSVFANAGGNNTYPDEIAPIAPAMPVLKYGTTTKVGGLRAQTDDYKLVYFGVGPEQVSDAAVGRSMIQLSHDWFYGIVGIEELDAALGTLGQAYPVPADTRLTIPVNDLQADATLEVCDAMGRVVARTGVTTRMPFVQVDTEHLANGLYSYRLVTPQSRAAARSFVVSH